MEDIRKERPRDRELQDAIVYNNGEIILIDELKKFNKKKTVKMDMFVMGIVLKGQFSITLNGKNYTAHENDMFICLPSNILENGLFSFDFSFHSICISPEYFKKLRPMSSYTWDLKMYFEKNPIFPLSINETNTFCQYYNLLCSKVHLPASTQEKVIYFLVQAFFYDVQHILDKMIKVSPKHILNSGELLFKRFLEILDASYPKNRKVDFYADKLHISPKYLSAVCKKTGEKTPRQIIDYYIMKDIEYLMKQSTKSIKEISNELDFPNISFFGKYVKKHFGLPPRDLRKSMLSKL